MSVLRPLLSRRGRLVFVATALLLIGALVAAPSISGAKAAIKQFTAVITPNTVVDGVSGTWTERVKNCGTPVAAPCTASSTIAIGRVRITVPSELTKITTPASVIASNGSTWFLTYDSGAGTITAQPDNGSHKLNSGEFVDIPFSATPDIPDIPNTCSSSKISFTTTAIGGLPSGPDNQTFDIVGSQPSLAIGCTDTATGQTDTVTGDFTGHVNITFGGAAPDCSSDADFGALGDQWQVYHQATPSTVTPANDFIPGGPKLWTTEFPLTTPPDASAPGDSSWYLTCYAVPQAGHTRFVSRGTVDGLAVDQEIPPGSGVHFWVGILASCADAPIPCVSEQFLTTGPTPPGPPWNPSDNRVHIAIRVDPGDPHRS
jgi:hypothetical protein